MSVSRPSGLGDRQRPAGRTLELTPAQADIRSSALTDLVVITGFSGAGKSTAMAAFEDEGYFCVDNLPPEMIRTLAELFLHEGSKVERAAVVSDARGGSYFAGLVAVLDELERSGVAHRVLFLEADEQTLLTRYKETRRRHPLSPGGSVADGVARERALLAPVRERADLVLETTGLTSAMLRRKLADELLPTRAPGRLAVTVQSFGFKHGPARDADLLFDVRFLPNPHYEPDLRPLTGLEPEVVAHIDRDGALQAFYERLWPMLDYLLPQYVAEGKAHLSIAIGCTGGRHRSVAIAEQIAARYREAGEYLVEVAHRDIDRAGRA
ncbi:MAG TPA: RNase adapter RapZ [Conexibacter sp.]|nr:RNase adapter RapZ [Conexibacter sp.]